LSVTRQTDLAASRQMAIDQLTRKRLR
jgi:hypothetical protein